MKPRLSQTVLLLLALALRCGAAVTNEATELGLPRKAIEFVREELVRIQTELQQTALPDDNPRVLHLKTLSNTIAVRLRELEEWSLAARTWGEIGKTEAQQDITQHRSRLRLYEVDWGITHRTYSVTEAQLLHGHNKMPSAWKAALEELTQTQVVTISLRGTWADNSHVLPRNDAYNREVYKFLLSQYGKDIFKRITEKAEQVTARQARLANARETAELWAPFVAAFAASILLGRRIWIRKSSGRPAVPMASH